MAGSHYIKWLSFQKPAGGICGARSIRQYSGRSPQMTDDRIRTFCPGIGYYINGRQYHTSAAVSAVKPGSQLIIQGVTPVAGTIDQRRWFVPKDNGQPAGNSIRYRRVFLKRNK